VILLNEQDMVKTSSLRKSTADLKFNTLLNVTKAIIENASIEELLTMYKKCLLDDLHVEKMLLYNFTASWEVVFIYGYKNDVVDHIDVAEDLLPHKDVTSISSLDKSQAGATDLLIPVFYQGQAIAFLLMGDMDDEKRALSPTVKHLKFIQTVTNIILVAIENKRLYQENIRQEALKMELALASKMQNMLIPNENSLPRNVKMFFSTYYLPHQEVGGDYYDFIQLNDSEVGFCIADVSGKGIAAAIVMSNFQATLRALFTDQISLSDLVTKLNRIVNENAKGEKYLTMFIGKYNSKTEMLTYINAAHIPPLLYNKDSGKLTCLTKGCIGMGMLEELSQINEIKIKISPNSKLICFTDGLIEFKYQSPDIDGSLEIEKYIMNKDRIDLNIKRIIEVLKEYLEKDMIFDDVSIIGIEFY
jgi:sigma-B regulation protein RsbU (phosphoserine phosphatase)